MSIDAATGVMTGYVTGTATIRYTIANGCSAAEIVTVNPQPQNIAGTLTVCTGTESTLSISPAITAIGTWSSSNTAVVVFGTASIGKVSGVASGTGIITYITDAGCNTTAVVTVNTSPAPITGPTELCSGIAATFSNVTPGGTWSSSNAGMVSVGMLSGVASVGAVGTAMITYKASGCFQVLAVTVNRQPAPIAGTLRVCEGAITMLGDITRGGTWSVSGGSVATLVAPDGEIKGISAGTTTVSYTLGMCAATATLTVSPLPGTITGDNKVCTGQAVTLACATPGGTWSSDNHAAAVGSSSGIVSGLLQGITNIQYTLPTGCRASYPVTVNTSPGAVYGSLLICEGAATTLTAVSVAAGAWSSGNPAVAVIGGDGVATGIAAGTSTITYAIPGTGCYATTIVSVNALPSAITGAGSICTGSMTTFASASAGGTWSSSAPGVAAIDAVSGVISGVSPGTATISYRLAPGCITTKTITVQSPPAAITGIHAICSGSSATLSCSPTGGTWSGGSSIADIDVATGVLTGVSPGQAVITYVSPTGCSVTTIVTINQLPGTITGNAGICIGAATTFSNDVAGGIWSSANTAVAEIGSDNGIIIGIVPGTATISYVLSTGCTTSSVVTVNTPPDPITGPSVVCEGATVVLASNTKGGAWSCISLSVYVLDAQAGTVKGVRAGTAIVTYTSAQGCSIYTTMSVSPMPDAGVITGNSNVCAFQNIALSDSVTGGNWTSSDPGIAAIAGPGLVTGVRAGEATILYTRTNACGSSSATTIIKVYDLVNAGKIIGPDIVCMGNSVAVSTTNTGGVWSSSDASIAEVGTNGTVKGMSYGTATLVYILSNVCSADTAKHTIAVRPSIDCMPDRDVITAIKIYPNPATSAFILETPVAGTFTVYTTDSRLVQQYPITGWVTKISLPAGLAKGIYFCNFIGYQGTTATFKLVFEP